MHVPNVKSNTVHLEVYVYNVDQIVIHVTMKENVQIVFMNIIQILLVENVKNATLFVQNVKDQRKMIVLNVIQDITFQDQTDNVSNVMKVVRIVQDLMIMNVQNVQLDTL